MSNTHHATLKRPVLVGRNGITMRSGKQAFIYQNAKTGQMQGQRVLVLFDPESPETVAVTDMNGENGFMVERSEQVPAMDVLPGGLSLQKDQEKSK